MTATWQALRDLRPDVLEDAGDAWHAVSGRSGADRVRVDRLMTARLRETQDSRSAAAALARLQRLSRNYQYLHTECGLIRTTLNALAADLAVPQRQLRQALDEAAELRFTVHEDGSVSFPAATAATLAGDAPTPGGHARGDARLPLDRAPDLSGAPPAVRPLNPNAEKAQALADRIARAVRAAADIDRKYAATLDRLRAAKGLDVTAATLADAARDTAGVRAAAGRHLGDGIPADRSPAELKAWWDGLPEEQRREYLDIAPDLIGGLDGIPAAARDEANRNHLPVLIDELARRHDDDSRTKLEALRMIQDRLREPSVPPMYLLGIGDEGNGRAIISYGNPDTSRNVSAYVPGLGTKLDGDFVEDTMKRAEDTAIGARRLDPSSASIIWLGYDAPQHLDVATAGDAENGAPAYNRFMAGLEATNSNTYSHLTAIGHSYGSFTVGTAAKQSDGIPGVDDVILLGSPGVGVDRAEDLGVAKEHVFVGSADNDLVTRMPAGQQNWAGAAGAVVGAPLGPLGSAASAYVMGDVADQGDDDLYFGRDPASEAFGAQRFKVDPGPHAVLQGGGFSAHSQYFTPRKDQVSADNIAAIVAGRPQEVVREEYR
ncbi:alpha/beta hydrolase [Streptomyces lavendulocolor]|uniref:alpha/beta hydrolase n=1 Tax=Streptomyces lavendulocolor TaxID=67316 RepID=UPI003C2FE37B